MFWKTLVSTTMVSGALALSAFMPTAGHAESTRADQQGDIAPLCGDQPMRIAMIDGYGGNIWRSINRAEAEDELSACDNVEVFRYSDAGGDQQKYSGDINSFVSQGMNIILAFTDFGDAAMPAYRKAQRDGVTVVPYFSQLSGTVGRDYAANPYQDQRAVGKNWADWVNTAKDGEANILFLGGVAGAASSAEFLAGIKEGIAPYAGLKLLEDDYVVTNWNAADAQKAVAGLIARYDDIDVIISDYGVVTMATVKAFDQAGLTIPTQVTIASNNELNCRYLEDKANGKEWGYMSVDGTTRSVRFAVRAAVAAFQGKDNPDTAGVLPFTYIDSHAGTDPVCDPDAPLDADFSAGLSDETLRALFK